MYVLYRFPTYPALNEEEIQIMKKFTKLIAQFTINGKPTNDNDEISWPMFKPGKGTSLLIDNPIKVSEKFPFQNKERPGRIQFWMDLLKHSESLQSDYNIHEEL